MDIKPVWEKENRLLLICTGQLHWKDREPLLQQVEQFCAGRSGMDLRLDLQAVDLVTSAGIGTLIELHRQLQDQGHELSMSPVPPVLMQLFTLVGLDRRIPMSTAIHAVGSGA